MGIRARFHHCDSGRGRHSHPTFSGCLFTASLPLSLLFPSTSTSLLSHHHPFLALGSANIGAGTEHEEAASERSGYLRGTGGVALGVDGRGRLAVYEREGDDGEGKGRGGKGVRSIGLLVKGRCRDFVWERVGERGFETRFAFLCLLFEGLCI